MERCGQVKRRTRDGCWTCRKRKKKCDGASVPCHNCARLELKCENEIKLMWEDDARRAGMKRRGPSGPKNSTSKQGQDRKETSRPRSKLCSEKHAQDAVGIQARNEASTYRDMSSASGLSTPGMVVRYQDISAYPRALDATESLLLEHYIKRFSREYPTCSGPSNPFLSVLLPLAMRSSVVLDSLLALSGAQRWDYNWSPMEKESLRLRQQALRGCRAFLGGECVTAPIAGEAVRSIPSAFTHFKDLALPCRSGAIPEENLLFLLTSSVLFLLYEKVSGEPSWKPHIEFISRFFERWLTSHATNPSTSTEVSESMVFLHDIFVYNDLVRATSLQTAPLSKFYLTAMQSNGAKSSPVAHTNFAEKCNKQTVSKHRYHFPNLIARLSSGDNTVTEADIATWDGSMDWLPSFALDNATRDRHTRGTDETIISELYRVAASIYRLQVLRASPKPGLTSRSDKRETEPEVLQQLAAFAHALMVSLPEGSVYENALLWPLGISAKVLTHNQFRERSDTILRLQSLEQRFQMRHFRKVQDVLLRHWAIQDNIYEPDVEPASYEQHAILLG